MRSRQLGIFAAVLATAIAGQTSAATRDVAKLVDQPDVWFTTEEGRRVVADIRSWQNPNGGWWKAYDVDTTRPATVPTNDDWHRGSTIDNDATTSELRILARAARVTQDAGCEVAFERGLRFLLAMQYLNGGWPQRFPLTGTYGDAITFNDDAMIHVMRLLRDVGGGGIKDFAFVQVDRSLVRAAVDRGVECILDAQIVLGGKPTAWCQQHDSKTLAPTKARAYELPSICTSESVGIVDFLMDVPHPSDRIKHSIDAAVAWFESVAIRDSASSTSSAQYENGKDVRLADAPGSVIWARYYDLKTGEPFVCDRDGVPRASLEQIGHERRVGYAWYNDRPARVIERYAKWKAANP